MDDLKPCPFCGSAADANQYLIEAAVWCPQCLATVTRSATADCDYSDMQLAASAWNTRTSEPVAIEALQAQLAEAREQRDRAIALAEKAQDRLIEAMDRVDEARDKALDDAAMVADGAPYKRGGIVCGCSEGLAGWTAAAIRAMKRERG